MSRRGLPKRSSTADQARPSSNGDPQSHSPMQSQVAMQVRGARLGRRAVRRRVLRFEWLAHRRVLASIGGQVFHDYDESLRHEGAEVGLENRVVYLDLDNDEEVDHGEPLAITDFQGRFLFDELPVGEYVVRLFNGTPTQWQTTPFAAEPVRPSISIVDPYSEATQSTALILGDDGLVTYTGSGNRLTEVDLEESTTRAVDLPGDVVDVKVIGSGLVLAVIEPPIDFDQSGTTVAGEEAGPSVFVVNFDSGTTVPVAQSANSVGRFWNALAIGTDGRGLVTPIGESGTSVPLHSVHYDVNTTQWSTRVLPLYVDASASLWGNQDWPVILVSQPAGDGTQVALWSVVNELVVPDTEALLGDITEVLAYDDPAGLLVVRGSDGGVRVLDSANGYATLHTVDDFTGPVVLDGHRELLFGLIDEFELGIFDIREGQFFPSVALEAPLGSAAGLALADRGDRIAIRHRGHVSQVRIDLPGAHRVSLTEDAMRKDVVFGLQFSGDNLAPRFTGESSYRIAEDSSLILQSPGVLASVINPDDDKLIAFEVGEASFGKATLRPDGSVLYQPLPNYFGIDSFDIRVSDGRDLTATETVTVEVWPVDDLPSGIQITIPKLPENLQGPAIIGTIEIDEVDGDPYLILLSDERFEVDGQDLIIVADAVFDHETEPFIELVVTAINPEDEQDFIVVQTVIELEDVDDPPTGITPNVVEVAENTPGAVVANLALEDPDTTDGYQLVVFDDRFVVEGFQVRLREDRALDYELAAVITIPVAVLDRNGATLLDDTLQINVIDTNDQITDILLSGKTLPERASAYTVGRLSAVDEDRDQTVQWDVDDSRFEIVDSQLKLRDGVYVRRTDQAEIEIIVTASDGVGASLSKVFILNVLENSTPYHNHADPTDVDGDGHTAPLDALIIINELNRSGPGILADPIQYEVHSPVFIDVNGDGYITPLDALIIINYLNQQSVASAEPTGAGGEGESTPTEKSPPEPSPVSSPDAHWSAWEFWDEDEDEITPQ